MLPADQGILIRVQGGKADGDKERKMLTDRKPYIILITEIHQFRQEKNVSGIKSSLLGTI